MKENRTSYLSAANSAYLEDLYEQFLQDPNSVSSQWRDYFNSLADGQSQAGSVQDYSHRKIQEQFRQMARRPKFAADAAATPSRQEAVDQLIIAYRRFGHLDADINPLGFKDPIDPRLELSYYSLENVDPQKKFLTRGVLPKEQAGLKEIYQALRTIYCGSIGIEYTRISDEQERAWIREYMERQFPEMTFTPEEKRAILHKLVAADGLEKYLERKYTAQKRFSIEGADALIPMLDELAKRVSAANVYEMVIGMAHRGRLNVLLNTLGQSPYELFQEFEGTKDYGMTTGDVKYHNGFSSNMKTPTGYLHLSLMCNPSHLEFVNTVIMGSVRARQERKSPQSDALRNYAVAVMIHGDASFIGQGITQETLSMANTRAYTVGGSIHIIVNNQVGFTTSDPRDSRSSRYCSDVAKMIDVPILHVNGDDAEATAKAVRIAVDYRMKFNKDVVIDLVCYRRHGHNEADEPRATQPTMYAIIDNHPVPREVYAKQLIQEKIYTEQQVKQLWDDYRVQLDEGRCVAPITYDHFPQRFNPPNWAPYINQSWNTQVDTTVARKKLVALGQKFSAIPAGFKLQRNVEMIFQARQKMTAGELPLDWGYAEMMAYASLLEEKYRVRFSGEDCRRGTFFHRHAVVFDQNSGKAYSPLAHLSTHQARFEIYDSLLSESGVIGFEYGYAMSDPNALVIWEAQYGDFANVAQVYIDQFLSSAWQKWSRLCGLVLLLPHGQQGEGPEHSSARLERYLQLCAQENMQVFVPSTPAQIFHLLRRQILRPYRTPLVVMSPKSLLRHKLAVSSLDDLEKGQLQLVIPEIDAIDPKKTRKVILCSGKVYYELLEKRREQKQNDIAIIRIEQLYPFPEFELKAALAPYKAVKNIVWCQEEPKNQGAWYIMYDRFVACLPEGTQFGYAGREAMAAPSGGYSALHKKQQAALIKEALS
ncbi:MAG: 2-oxoglutarate dehydrogenase E1 component [Proteobacteria bacterium]|nr:2-oxoglutarate dehydrogenase E1 component [Pseudomonadota bacterium]